MGQESTSRLQSSIQGLNHTRPLVGYKLSAERINYLLMNWVLLDETIADLIKNDGELCKEEETM